MKPCAKESDLKVVFCDNHLLIVNKLGGMPTQSEDGRSLHDLAKLWVKKNFDKAGNVFLEPIHRLDKSVSGLVLFARTSKALSRLNEQMRERKITKTYYAWVEGAPVEAEKELEHFLLHEEYRAAVVDRSHPKAKQARLRYTVLKTNHNRSYLEIELYTGRYHQIRAQLSAIGCPIIGDRKYGSKAAYGEGKIALHHGLLQFAHPVTKEEQRFKTGDVLRFEQHSELPL